MWSAMPELPTGTVTFLFTDLEGSTRLWELYPDAMQPALARHDEILRAAVAKHDGHIVKSTGDGIHAVFATAHRALDAAVTAQRAFGTEPWPVPDPLKVRMGLHTGEAEHRDGDYYGAATNRAARIMSVAHGGQILVTLSTEQVLADSYSGDVSLRDLGEQRLRDLSRAERVFQVDALDLATDFPPIRTLDAYPGNLPLQMTSFVGRHEELVALGKALRDARLVTLTGTGGVGKTRLSVQLAAEILQRFPDGAWFCELAAVGDAEAMVQVVAATLNVQPRPGMSLDEAIVEFLHSKHALLLLDNCEHLLEPAGTLVDDILGDCEHVRVIATSREALGLAGERVWPLRSLGLPENEAIPAAIETSEAGRLFTERAEAARPGFAVDTGNAGAVTEICRRLDGIPLAIELAAARVVAMTPTEIAGHLDERFRLLTGGRRAAVERHRTLRAAVEWSYSLLETVDRAVFNRLGVFAGTFDAHAASEVVATGKLEPWDVLDALTSLVTKSMIVAETGPDDTTRYQMLETMRQYALEQLDSHGDADEFRRRHAEYYARFATEAGAGIIGRDELQWRPRILAERDNLRAAVYWALDRDDDEDSAIALRIIAPVAYESVLDPPLGVSAWAERALERATRFHGPERIAVLGAAAWEATNRAEHAAIEAIHRDAMRESIDTESIAPGLVSFAMHGSLNQQARSGEASELAVASAAALHRIGVDRFGQGMLHLGASYWAVKDNDFDAALHQAELAIAIAREIENPSTLLSALCNIGGSLEHDDPVAALDAYEEAIEFAR
jgi:predicted ATPase/class 3 adenylate cyclase